MSFAPMSTSPDAAISEPMALYRENCSFKNAAASSAVKNACDCRMSELNPVGAPSLIAVNSKPNSPTPRTRP